MGVFAAIIVGAKMKKIGASCAMNLPPCLVDEKREEKQPKEDSDGAFPMGSSRAEEGECAKG
jgi:hypothetical protein